jgi:hypothetical protein
MSRVIRVDPEVYEVVVRVKADLEKATGQARSFNDAVALLIALAGGEWRLSIGSTAGAPSGRASCEDA